MRFRKLSSQDQGSGLRPSRLALRTPAAALARRSGARRATLAMVRPKVRS